MKLPTLKCIAAASLLAVCTHATAHDTTQGMMQSTAQAEPGRSYSFAPSNGVFLLNGKPFVIKAAELHYPRIPAPYWEHRIKMCKALGMNTICLYSFWNFHESAPGKFNFSGQHDIRHFIELCAKHDMKVILRPGPYVCAEWEMGGLPWWLLKNKDIRLRENGAYFMARVDTFQRALARETAHLTAPNGGPIIMVQVENEYGSYGTDKQYVAAIRDILRKYYGPDITLFQCDWSSNFLNNGLDDLLWTLNFGTGSDIDAQFAPLKSARPDSPLMCSEYWSGWFDKWGANHETRPAADMIAGIDEMLSKGISFSLYMTHGGTNRGHWAGANSPGYAPDVTSYDYDAPINEQGAPTPKYHALRSLLQQYSDTELPPVPDSIPLMSVPEFTFTQCAPLFDNLPPAFTDTVTRTMEEYDQGFGSILYTTTLPACRDSTLLTVTEPHDYASIHINGERIGTLDRRLNQSQLTLPPLVPNSRLDILVEGMGRINFGRAIKDFKGITQRVTLTDAQGTQELNRWSVCLLPDDYAFYSQMHLEPIEPALPQHRLAPGLYRATFTLHDTPCDTYLDFSNFGKGLVYVNGHGIGRIWEIGPQQTIYVPGAWLKEGENEVLVFDILGPRHPSARGLDYPINDTLRGDSPKNDTHHAPDTSDLTPALSGEWSATGHWQETMFAQPVTGRYICLEALASVHGDSVAAIAELHLLDDKGERISRESWRPAYADSQDTTHGNHGLDKAFDLQESTYWLTAPHSPYPHRIVIDLGSEHTLTGIQILPRSESGSPGAIKTFNLYVTPHRP